MRPRSATRFLFAVRVLPCLLGLAAVLALCVPSYLWLEPQASSERIGWACLTLALFGALGWLASFARVALSLRASRRLSRAWRQAGRETLFPGELSKALIVDEDGPLLALAGIFRPRLVVSRGMLQSLSAEELQLALQHENAHRFSRDNLKRLLLLLLPAPIPFFRGLSSFERCWARLSEWAADDEAVRGNSHSGLLLAAALLRVARMCAPPRLSFLHTSLSAGDLDLSARVDRLLRVEPHPAKPLSRPRSFVLGATLGMVGLVVMLLAGPATLSSAHRLLELFLR